MRDVAYVLGNSVPTEVRRAGEMAVTQLRRALDAMARLETMVLMAGLELPLIAIRRQAASAFNLVVHLGRLSDGTRKVTHITEISGMEGDIITMSDIFRFEQTGVGSDGKITGQLKATGLRPLFSPRLEVVGYKLGGEIFGALPLSAAEVKAQSQPPKR